MRTDVEILRNVAKTRWYWDISCTKLYGCKRNLQLHGLLKLKGLPAADTVPVCSSPRAQIGLFSLKDRVWVHGRFLHSLSALYYNQQFELNEKLQMGKTTPPLKQVGRFRRLTPSRYNEHVEPLDLGGRP